MVLITKITTYPENVRYLSNDYFIGETGNLYHDETLVGTLHDFESVIGMTRSREPLKSVEGVFSYVSNDQVVTTDFHHQDHIVGIYGDIIISSQDEDFDDFSVETVLYFRNEEYITQEIFALSQRYSTNSDKFAVYMDKCFIIRRYAGNISLLEEATETPGSNILLRPCERIYSSDTCLYAINGNVVYRLE